MIGHLIAVIVVIAFIVALISGPESAEELERERRSNMTPTERHYEDLREAHDIVCSRPPYEWEPECQ